MLGIVDPEFKGKSASVVRFASLIADVHSPPQWAFEWGVGEYLFIIFGF